MKTILLPTDFSEAAAGAFQYACQLPEQQENRLVVFHVYHPDFDFSNPYPEISAPDLPAYKQKQIEAFIKEVGNICSTGPESELRIGFAGEEIVRRSSEADLVVMGTSGMRGIEHLLGSISTYVSQHAHCPVLLVPRQSTFRQVKKLLYASQAKNGDEAVLREALRKTGLQPGEIHLVYAEETGQTGFELLDVRYKQWLSQDGSGLNIRFARIQCEDVVDGLDHYIQAEKIDFLVMSTEHRSFLQRLFHRSTTRRMIFQAPIPMLVMHINE